MAKKPAIICETTKDADGNDKQIKYNVKDLPSGFELETEIKHPDGKMTKGPTADVTQTGTYTATGKLIYSGDGDTETVVVPLESCSIQATASPDIEGKVDPDKGLTTGQIAGIAIGGFSAVVVTAVLVGLVIYFVRKRSKSGKATTALPVPTTVVPVPSVKKAGQRRKPNAHEKVWVNVLLSVKVKGANVCNSFDEVKKRFEELKKTDPEKFLKEFNDKQRAREDAEKAKGNVIELKGCRYEGEILMMTQLVLKDAKVKNPRCLHTNLIQDYNNMTILLSQAPTKEQLFEFILACLENMIGVLAVVGMLNEKGKEKIYPYWSTEAENVPVILKEVGGNREIKVLTTSTYMVGGNKVYKLTVWLEGKKERHEMDLLHVEDWEDKKGPRDMNDLRLAVLELERLQKEQAEKGRPGTAFHCSGGYQRSAALLNASLNWQCWQDCGIVNVDGVMEYIRRHRMNVLSEKLDELNPDIAFLPMLVAAETIVMLIDADEKGQTLEDLKKLSKPKEGRVVSYQPVGNTPGYEVFGPSTLGSMMPSKKPTMGRSEKSKVVTKKAKKVVVEEKDEGMSLQKLPEPGPLSSIMPKGISKKPSSQSKVCPVTTSKDKREKGTTTKRK